MAGVETEWRDGNAESSHRKHRRGDTEAVERIILKRMGEIR